MSVRRRAPVRARRDPRRRAPGAPGRLRTRRGARTAHASPTSRKGDLWTADADGTHAARIVKSADQPAWSPNGRRLAFTRGGSVYTVRADGDDERKLAVGAHPAWSPNGDRIALDRDDTIVTLRWDGGGVRNAGTGSDPAYAPDGRLAVVRDGEIVAGGRIVDAGTEPTWSADGKHVAYVRDDTIYIDGKARSPRRAARLAACASAFRNCCPTSTSGLQPTCRSPAGRGAGCSASRRSSTTSGSARASSRAFARRARSG